MRINLSISAIAASALAATLIGAVQQGHAQTPPPDVKAALLEQQWGRDTKARDEYESLLKAAPKDGVKVTKDLAYGKDPRQKVDVYQMPGKSNLPVMVFFHGGGYRASART